MKPNALSNVSFTHFAPLKKNLDLTFLPGSESPGYFRSLCTCAVDSNLFISIRAVIVIISDTTENGKWGEKQAICHDGGGPQIKSNGAQVYGYTFHSIYTFSIHVLHLFLDFFYSKSKHVNVEIWFLLYNLCCKNVNNNNKKKKKPTWINGKNEFCILCAVYIWVFFLPSSKNKH